MRHILAFVVLVILAVPAFANGLPIFEPPAQVEPPRAYPNLSGAWSGYTIEQHGRVVIVTGSTWCADGVIYSPDCVVLYWHGGGTCGASVYRVVGSTLVGRWGAYAVWDGERLWGCKSDDTMRRVHP